MAIQAYFGMTGSGKSYNSIANILVPALKDNRTVVTNVPLKKSALFADIDKGNVITLPKDMNEDNVAQYLKTENFPSGCVFIIDECFSLFPTGQKANQVPTTLKEFFSKHRHEVGYDKKASDIYLLSQSLDQLAAWVRTLIRSMVIHTDLGPTGLKGQYRCDFYQFELIGTKSKEKFISSSIGKIKAPYYDYYISNSGTDSGYQGDVLENIIDERTGLAGAHKKNILIGGITLFIAILLIVYSVSGLMSEDDQGGDLNLPVESIEQDKTPMPSGISSSTSKFPIANYRKPIIETLPASEEWRLTGIIRSSRHKVAIIRSISSSVQIDLLSNCFYSKDISDWACWFQDALVAYHTGPSFDYQESNKNDLGDSLPSFSL